MNRDPHPAAEAMPEVERVCPGARFLTVACRDAHKAFDHAEFASVIVVIGASSTFGHVFCVCRHTRRAAKSGGRFRLPCCFSLLRFGFFHFRFREVHDTRHTVTDTARHGSDEMLPATVASPARACNKAVQIGFTLLVGLRCCVPGTSFGPIVVHVLTSHLHGRHPRHAVVLGYLHALAWRRSHPFTRCGVIVAPDARRPAWRRPLQFVPGSEGGG